MIFVLEQPLLSVFASDRAEGGALLLTLKRSTGPAPRQP